MNKCTLTIHSKIKQDEACYQATILLLHNDDARYYSTHLCVCVCVCVCVCERERERERVRAFLI